jgi:hypothetical protein
MEALHEIGAIDKQTMPEFDESCLAPCRLLLGEIRARCASVSTCRSQFLPVART